MRLVLRLVLAVLALFLVFVMSRPGKFHIERSTTISAPAEIVYAQIADYHKWAAWSPWEHLDPNMKKDFAGTDGAVGASYHWEGNKDVGEGRMTTTAVEPPNRMAIKGDYILDGPTMLS